MRHKKREPLSAQPFGGYRGLPVYVTLGLLTGAMAASARAADEASFVNPTLEQWIADAIPRHPEVRAHYLEAEASHAEGQHHAVWEAPEASLDFYNAPVSHFPDPLSQQQEIDWSVAQKFPWPGKLEPMSTAAHLKGNALEKRAERSEAELRQQIIEASATLAWARSRVKLNLEAQSVIRNFNESSRIRYQSGWGTQADLLRLEAEKAGLEAEAALRENEVHQAEAQLILALGYAPKDIPDSALRFTLLPPPPSLEALKKKAVQARPDLKSMQLMAEMQKNELAVARKSLFPEVMLRATYKEMLHQPSDDWSVMVGFSIPFMPWSLTGWKQGVQAAQALHLKAEQETIGQRRKLEIEVEQGFYTVVSTWKRLQLLQNRLAPLADQALQVRLLAYRNGGKEGTSFAEVLMALRDARQAHEEVEMAQWQHTHAWAALELALGASVPFSGPNAPLINSGDQP